MFGISSEFCSEIIIVFDDLPRKKREEWQGIRNVLLKKIKISF